MGSWVMARSTLDYRYVCGCCNRISCVFVNELSWWEEHIRKEEKF